MQTFWFRWGHFLKLFHQTFALLRQKQMEFTSRHTPTLVTGELINNENLSDGEIKGGLTKQEERMRGCAKPNHNQSFRKTFLKSDLRSVAGGQRQKRCAQEAYTLSGFPNIFFALRSMLLMLDLTEIYGFHVRG